MMMAVGVVEDFAAWMTFGGVVWALIAYLMRPILGFDPDDLDEYRFSSKAPKSVAPAQTRHTAIRTAMIRP